MADETCANAPQTQQANGQAIYILDTGVLYDYLRGQAGFGTTTTNAAPAPVLRPAIEAMFATQRVVIPYVTLVEIVGQFFHTRIELDDYERWYRLRRAAFNPVLDACFDRTARIQLRTRPPRMDSLDRAHKPISANIRQFLATHLRNRKQQSLRDREPKYLDGMDSHILDEAVCVALENPKDRCEMVSGDVPLLWAVDEIRRQSQNNPRLPHNLFFRFTNQLSTLARQQAWTSSRSNTP